MAPKNFISSAEAVNREVSKIRVYFMRMNTRCTSLMCHIHICIHRIFLRDTSLILVIYFGGIILVWPPRGKRQACHRGPENVSCGTSCALKAYLMYIKKSKKSNCVPSHLKLETSSASDDDVGPPATL